MAQITVHVADLTINAHKNEVVIKDVKRTMINNFFVFNLDEEIEVMDKTTRKKVLRHELMMSENEFKQQMSCAIRKLREDGKKPLARALAIGLKEEKLDIAFIDAELVLERVDTNDGDVLHDCEGNPILNSDGTEYTAKENGAIQYFIREVKFA